MSKPTKEHKARALKRIQLMINDWFISPAARDELPYVKTAIYNELLSLEKRETALLAPPRRAPSSRVSPKLPASRKHRSHRRRSAGVRLSLYPQDYSIRVIYGNGVNDDERIL